MWGDTLSCIIIASLMYIRTSKPAYGIRFMQERFEVGTILQIMASLSITYLGIDSARTLEGHTRAIMVSCHAIDHLW